MICKLFRFLFLFFALNCFSVAYGDDKTPPPPPAPETAEQKLAAALKREEELKLELDKLKKGPPAGDPPPPNDDLIKKVQKDKETAAEVAKQTKEIERALGFNMRIDAFVAENKELLPAEVPAIVAQANKETYDNAQAKAAAVKSAIIQSYFSVQANLDAITPAQKAQVQTYLTLTKTAKEAGAPDIYENIFEPAIETVRKIRKAEEVSRSRTGFAANNETNTAYKDRLVRIARKTHLGEKESAV